MNKNFDYVYDAKDECWICFYGDGALFSVSREKVVIAKVDFFHNQLSELQAFKMMCSEIIMDELNKCDNSFVISAVMKCLFN